MEMIPLLNWYRIHKRNLPWRETQDPYLIWLSEVIMQQTRVNQGLPYYLKITAAYPDMHQLAKATKDDFFKLWQGLGYYNRAENLLHTAQHVVKKLAGRFPDKYEELIQLKGIGPYTAAAISSIAFGERKAVVDGNVSRVLSRLYALKVEINSTKGKNIFSELAQENLYSADPGEYNQAIMELGALICTPQKPDCRNCPLMSQCQAFLSGKQENYPVKIAKKKPVARNIHFLFMKSSTHVLIQKRSGSDIWKNLYEPPNFDHSSAAITSTDVYKEAVKRKWIPKSYNESLITHHYSTRHQLTHQSILATFWILDIKQHTKLPETSGELVTFRNLQKLPVHRLFDKFLNYYNLHK